MTTPTDLYNMACESVSNTPADLIGCYYNFIEESGMVVEDYTLETDRLQIKVIKEFQFDSRRYWRLATVWFNHQPIMITQNAGREGDDHNRRIITDLGGFNEMIKYIRSMIPLPPNDVEVFESDKDIEGITEFYGNKLDGHFQVVM